MPPPPARYCLRRNACALLTGLLSPHAPPTPSHYCLQRNACALHTGLLSPHAPPLLPATACSATHAPCILGCSHHMPPHTPARYCLQRNACALLTGLLSLTADWNTFAGFDLVSVGEGPMMAWAW